MSALRGVLAVSACALASLLAPPAARAGGNNLDGQMAPELALTDGLNGASASTTLASLRGKVVCLKFWLTRCPVCRATLPAFQAIHDRYGRSGVYAIGVVIDNAEGVGPYLREAGWTFPVGCDPRHANADNYGVSHYPADYIIGIDGRVKASNGFPNLVIEEELRKARVAEWGTVPDSLAGARDAVEDGNYGEALRIAEPLAKASDAESGVQQAVARLVEISTRRQDNRFARADAAAKSGAPRDAQAEFERCVVAFKGTSLEARAKQRLDAFLASQKGG